MATETRNCASLERGNGPIPPIVPSNALRHYEFEASQLLHPGRPLNGFSPSPQPSEQGSISSVDSYFAIHPGNMNTDFSTARPGNYLEEMAALPYFNMPINDYVAPEASYQVHIANPSMVLNNEPYQPRATIVYSQSCLSNVYSSTSDSENLPAQFDQLNLASPDETMFIPTGVPHDTIFRANLSHF